MIVSERRARAAALLCESAALRMPIVGSSMNPSLHEPMIMQVGTAERARIGDVLIFSNGRMFVAHRIVGSVAGDYLTAGDAQPHIVERVPQQDVVGRVVAVWSDGSAQAQRVDRHLFHRARSWYFARAHGMRRRARLAGAKAADLFHRAQPRRRQRTTQQVVSALTAAVRADAPQLARALAVDAQSFGIVDARHRVAAMLGDAARDLRVADGIPADMAGLLRRARLAAVLGAERMQRAVEKTMEVLEEAGIPFALLKGAARIYSATPQAGCHYSDDIDVLVKRADLRRALKALMDRGWTQRDNAAEIVHFERSHHHVASLFPPSGDFPVELHHALAPPGSLSTRTDWEALERRLVPLPRRSGLAFELDPVGTAIHLAIHAIGLTRLRDAALLAQLLRRLAPAQRAAVAEAIAAERQDPVRLSASAVLAARIAGLEWPHAPAADDYVDWALRREDLPHRLRLRCDVIEARTAWPWSVGMTLRCFIPWWSRGAQLLALPARVAGRFASNVAAFAYARLMRSPDDGSV